MLQIHAEDVVVGAIHDLGSYLVTAREVLEFSQRWDPQDGRSVDTTAAYFGGAIASGLHSLAIMQRLTVLQIYRHWAVIAGQRIADVQFRAPVRPGMTLRATLEVDAVEFLDDRQALVTVTKTLSNEGEVLVSAAHELLMSRRGADSTPARGADGLPSL